MKCIIAGSRSITDYKLIERSVIDSGFVITEVVSGVARGADLLGEKWALSNNIPIKQFKADWDKFGKSAGYKRNAQMGEYADCAICIRLNNSKGTSHMIDIMKKLNKPVYVKDI